MRRHSGEHPGVDELVPSHRQSAVAVRQFGSGATAAVEEGSGAERSMVDQTKLNTLQHNTLWLAEHPEGVVLNRRKRSRAKAR